MDVIVTEPSGRESEGTVAIDAAHLTMYQRNDNFVFVTFPGGYMTEVHSSRVRPAALGKVDHMSQQETADAYRKATGASRVTLRAERRNPDGSLTVESEAISDE